MISATALCTGKPRETSTEGNIPIILPWRLMGRLSDGGSVAASPLSSSEKDMQYQGLHPWGFLGDAWVAAEDP